MKTLAPSILLATALVLCAGCGSSGAPTEAPPVTAKVKSWKDMTKEEKIAQIQKSPMPEDAKQKNIASINAGGQ